MSQDSSNAGQAFFKVVVGDAGNAAEWHGDAEDGQLAVDVIDTQRDVLVVSTMAGTVANRLEVSIHNDLLTIRGVRSSPIGIGTGAAYLHQECFWGNFSRSIVLPVHVKGDLARAEYRNGVLLIRIPKRNPDAQIPVTIVDE